MRRLPIFLLFPLLVQAAGNIHTVTYPPSSIAGELIYGVTYRLWIPDGVKTIRALIVHQHGCGVGATKQGLTAADDLHWQALAKKWDAALLGPSYHTAEGQDCRKWSDPRNGSEKTFLRALSDFARQTGRRELEQVPWCLWGHSGGGTWASLMQTLHPERIAGIWLRSGTAFEYWEKGDIPKPVITDAVYRIPVMCNPGVIEKGHERNNPSWTGTRAMFVAYRQRGAPIGFAPDPITGHETGDSRYLAIPFFDACIKVRLMKQDRDEAWLAPLEGSIAQPASAFTGDKNATVWLPNATFAKAWMEYVKTGGVSDTTPPPPPTRVRKQIATGSNDLVLTWEAEADFESGLQAFVVEADGMEIGRVPEKSVSRFGRPLFQGKTYGDTPEAPLVAMRIVIKNPTTGARPPVLTVSSINSAGLKSAPAKIGDN